MVLEVGIVGGGVVERDGEIIDDTFDGFGDVLGTTTLGLGEVSVKKKMLRSFF
jgi:hypothetical protein